MFGTNILLPKSRLIHVAALFLRCFQRCVDAGLKLTPLQRLLSPALFRYQDILMSARSWSNSGQMLELVALHAMSHISKLVFDACRFIYICRTRSLIMKNNVNIAKAVDSEENPPECRDQGYTRPKVLVLLPYKNTAYTFIHALYTASSCKSFEGKSRFETEFAPDEELEAEKRKANKPEDHQHAFAGNTDDHFRIGLKFTASSIMKAYAEFYGSDVIIASPLGLRTLIGAKEDKKRDYDYLSSIELLIIDRCETFLMQNWEHLEHTLEHVNLLPTTTRKDTDYSRIKNWYLDGRAAEKRQTVIISEYMTPEIHSLISRFTKSPDILLHIARASYVGSIAMLSVQTVHVCFRSYLVIYFIESVAI